MPARHKNIAFENLDYRALYPLNGHKTNSDTWVYLRIRGTLCPDH